MYKYSCVLLYNLPLDSLSRSHGRHASSISKVIVLWNSPFFLDQRHGCGIGLESIMLCSIQAYKVFQFVESTLFFKRFCIKLHCSVGGKDSSTTTSRFFGQCFMRSGIGTGKKFGTSTRGGLDQRLTMDFRLEDW